MDYSFRSGPISVDPIRPQPRSASQLDRELLRAQAGRIITTMLYQVLSLLYMFTRLYHYFYVVSSLRGSDRSFYIVLHACSDAHAYRRVSGRARARVLDSTGDSIRLWSRTVVLIAVLFSFSPHFMFIASFLRKV